MKKILFFIIMAVFLITLIPFASAENTDAFIIDERCVFSDMSRSYLQGYEPAVAWDYLTLLMPIRSDKAIGSINAELILLNEEVALFKPQNMNVRGQRLGDGLWGVRFSRALVADRVNGDYCCTVRVTGSDEEGKELSSDIPIIIPVRDGRANPEPVQVTISDDKSSLNVGEDGMIALKLSNRSKTVGYDNLSLSFSDPGGDILPKGMDTVLVGDLMPGESFALSWPVKVRSNAKVIPHSLHFEFSGQSLGKDVEFSVNYTVQVLQEIRLEQGGLRMADSVVAGDAITATLPLMNMGKADIHNAMATIALPGITERQSVLVGTIQPGETKQAQITLTGPKDAFGESNGTLTVYGEDNDGNSTSFELPVSLKVEEAVKSVALDARETAKQKTPVSVILLSCTCALLVAALIFQRIMLRSRIHSLEEEKL